MKLPALRLSALLFFPLLILLFTGCGDDDDDSDQDDLIGTWQLSSANTQITIDGQDLIEWLADQLGISEDEAEDLSDQFSEVFEVEDFEETLTFNVDGTVESESDGDTEAGEWMLSGDTLTITIDGDSASFEVVTLNSSTLVLQINDTQNQDLDGDGSPEELVTSVEFTFGRG